MARLPNVGGDDSTWGTVLNDFLQVEHNADGTLKTVAVSKGGTGATDAATARSNLGAAAATDLAGKADDTAVVHLAAAETLTGAKDFTGGATINGQNIVVTSDARLSDARTPTGAAGGGLTGTYPNPTLAVGAAAANLGYTPVNQAGDTMSGNLTVGNATTAGVIAVDGPANQFKFFEWHAAGVRRYASDLDTGANWGLNRYDSSGVFQQTVLVALVNGGLQVLPNGAGAVTIRAARDDTKLFSGSIQFYLDEVGNNLNIRVMYSDGTTLKTGTVALA